MDKPITVNVGIQLLWICLIFDIIRNVSNIGFNLSSNSIILYISFILYYATFAYFLNSSGKGNKRSRSVLLGLIILEVPLNIVYLVIELNISTIWWLVGIVLILLNTFAITLFFKKPSSEWYNENTIANNLKKNKNYYVYLEEYQRNIKELKVPRSLKIVFILNYLLLLITTCDSFTTLKTFKSDEIYSFIFIVISFSSITILSNYLLKNGYNWFRYLLIILNILFLVISFTIGLNILFNTWVSGIIFSLQYALRLLLVIFLFLHSISLWFKDTYQIKMTFKTALLRQEEDKGSGTNEVE